MFAHRCYCPVWVFERLRPSRWSGQVLVKPMGGAVFLLGCPGSPGLQWVRYTFY